MTVMIEKIIDDEELKKVKIQDTVMIVIVVAREDTLHFARECRY